MTAKEYLKSKGLKNPPLDSGISGGGDAPRVYASDAMQEYATQEKQGWVKITPETMPPIPSYVLVTNWGYFKAVWYGIKNGQFTYINDNGETDYVDNATHYLVLPQKPEV